MLRDPGKLSMSFSVVFQASTGTSGKKHGNIYVDFMRFGDSSTVNGLHESLPKYYFKGLKQPIIIHL